MIDLSLFSRAGELKPVCDTHKTHDKNHIYDWLDEGRYLVLSDGLDKYDNMVLSMKDYIKENENAFKMDT